MYVCMYVCIYACGTSLHTASKYFQFYQKLFLFNSVNDQKLDSGKVMERVYYSECYKWLFPSSRHY